MISTAASAAAKSGAIAGLKALRRELARKRGDEAPLASFGEIDDAIEEALDVLANRSEGLGGAIRTGVKALLVRPDLFADGPPREWIVTQEARDSLKALTMAAIHGEDTAPHADRARAHYDLFDKGEGASPAEDVIEEALDFIVRSLRRDLTLGERIGIGMLADLKSQVERLAPSDTGALADAEVSRRLDRLRRSRFFVSADARAEAARFGDALIDGSLRGASANVRGTALAWCARLLAYKDEMPGPERYLEAAGSILGGDSEVLRVARAFAVARTDFAQGLAMLDPDASTLQATAAFQIMRLGLELDDALARAEKAGLEIAALDSDGRYALLVSLIETRRWDEAMLAARQLGEEDFAATPALLWAAGTLLVASRTRDDLKPLVLQQVPANPADFLLGTDSATLQILRQAGSLMERAAAACDELGLPTEAAAARRFVLWLKLRDPERKTEGLEELRAKMSGAGQIAWLPFALGFGLEVKVDEAEEGIERQLARNPNPSAEMANALVALLLHHAVTDPKRGLDFLASHRDLFDLFIDRKSLLGLEAKMLTDAGRPEDAQALIEANADDFPKHLKTLIESSIERDGKGTSIEALESAFAEQPETQRLLALVFAYLKRDEPARLMELARTLLAEVPDSEVATDIIRHLAEKEHDEEAIELFELLGDGTRHSPALMTMAGWLYFRQGRFTDSERLLEELEKVRDEEPDRRLRYQLLIATGRWEEVDEFIERQWRKRDHRSAVELGQFAMVSAQAGAKRTADLAKAAAEKGPKDPEVLIAAYSAMTTAGLEEDDPQAGQWIIEAAAHSSKDGPIRKASLQELVDRAPDRNKRVDDATEGLAAGTMPLDLVGRLVHRPWLELHLAALLGNERLADGRRRRIVPLFSGRKSNFRNRPLEETEASLDTSAIVTLAAVESLDRVLASFERVHVRHDALTDLYTQRNRVSFHQPSRIAFAHQLVELVARKKVRPFQTAQVPPISLVTDLGQDCAEMLFEAATAGGGQHLFVHPYPITRAGSLLTETVPLDQYRDQLVSCGAVIDALARLGRLRSEEAEAANAYLSLHEQRWPNEPKIAKGATLYLSGLAVAYFRHTKMLDRIVDAGLTPIVPASELRDAEALLELEASSTEVEAVLDKARAAVASHAAEGRVRFAPIGGSDEDGPAQSIGQLVARSRLLVTDERFLNRFENFDHEQGRTRISSSIDLLSQLAAASRLDPGRLDEIRTRLRAMGAIYVPLERDELARRIASTDLAGEDGDARILETGELRAIRENIRLAQARGWFDPAVDSIWLTQAHLALSDTLMEQWKGDVADELAAARSNWLLGLIDFPDWADSVVNRHFDLAAYGRILDISKLIATAPQLRDQPRERLNRWLEQEVVAPFLDREPMSREALFSHLRSLVRVVAADVARMPPRVSERTAGRAWFDSFARRIQLGLLEDKEFAKWIGYSLQSSIEVEGSSFALADFAKAVRGLYAGAGAAQSVTDSGGRSWDVTTDPADRRTLILRSGELDYRTPAIPGLLPSAKQRVEALDDRLRSEGVDPQALEEWREKLRSAVADADDLATIDAAIRLFPPFRAGMIAQALQAGAEPSALVPRDAAYYERLVGTTGAGNLEDFVRDPGRLSIDWFEGKPVDRAAWLLLRASQPRILADSDVAALNAANRRKLGKWLARSGDLFAKVGFIELALRHAHEDAELEKSILKMVHDIVALDPEDETGTLHLLAGLVIFTESELSQQGTLTAWPPFRRRQAAIAQASLIVRVLAGQEDTKDLANFCIARGGWRFAVQNHMDLRREPRWRPDLAAADQLRYEAIGRLANAAAVLDDGQLTDGLRNCFREEKSPFRKAFGIQMFFPGPLEGGTANPLGDLPAEMLNAIDAGLDALPLTFEALNPLLNCNNMFKLPAGLLERAVARVQEAGPRLFGNLDGEQVSAYLLALASLAAAERLTGLADAVQVLARHHRDRSKVPVQDEMRLALTAAASIEDEPAWREKIGLWTLELAAIVEDRDEARSLLGWLDTMGDIDPPLRAYIGRARANLCLLLER